LICILSRPEKGRVDRVQCCQVSRSCNTFIVRERKSV
jgi:hypothetical protein